MSRFACLAVALCSSVWVAGPLWGQAVPPGMVTSGWVAEQVTGLASGDAARQQKARQQLMRAADHPDAPASFPGALAGQLRPILAGRDTRAKLNAGVVIEHVTGRTASPALEPAARQLMADECPAIALWGVKAAAHLIPATSGAALDRLTGAIVDAARRHPASGPVAEEAFAALAPAPSGAAVGKMSDATLATLTTRSLDLLELRIDQYGNDVPPSPGAEAPAFTFLALSGWSASAQAPPVRTRILKDLGRLTTAAANAIASDHHEPQLAEVVRYGGKAFGVLGPALDDPAITSAAKTLAGVSASTPPATVQNACNALAAALATHNAAIQ